MPVSLKLRRMLDGIRYIVMVVFYLKIGTALNHGVVSLPEAKLIHIDIMENHSSKAFCILTGNGSTEESGEAISRKEDKGTVYQALLPSDSPESLQVELDFVGHSLWVNRSQDYH